MLASLLRIILLTATLKILERGLDKGPIIRNTTWRNTENDQIYEAAPYHVYVTGPNSDTAIVQDVDIFGDRDKANSTERLNLTTAVYNFLNK